ncbi:gliding motility-associated C-terminal domain-containing protein [Muricauda oceani]|uniref:Gliding motility-associated C-terminal domain-containing protein n=1 Tax=Flagellimonas oceani TaxID=2698672 RepID=A0A6G7J895_9FLAO|nr:gliding motility-associated C-terminal domain-containing protein [Allomuricauda oceani]MBW8242001.1 gliding motility-associated C-terminal domain-containing protein [Allomuricauda oceani]QII46910.1 gliding motility-associated C-terminal domain-containing protein [Allomuricauda oceani]
MKTIYGIFLLWFLNLPAQEGTRNLGMLKIHDQGAIGFHGNLTNDGIFDDNQGLAGFYSLQSISLTGLFPPRFMDLEFFTEEGLQLEVSLEAENNINFIQGDVKTPRTDAFVSLRFYDGSFHTGTTNISKVDGYVSVKNKPEFIFPVGDDQQLRALILQSESINTAANCAYFYSDPANLTSIGTNTRENMLMRISPTEFWRLEGTVPSTIQISWNQRSRMPAMANSVDEITVVGWSKTNNRWENLGTGAVGNLTEGVAFTTTFIPDDYEAITFGTLNAPEDIPDLDNYLLTPNGDGINDFLNIDELALSNDNWVRIYDRNGMLVFEMHNYTDEFTGYANKGDVVINRNNGLPQGVYFYLVSLDDLGLEYQGYLYLAR